MSFLSAFSSFLNSPLFKTFTSGLLPLIKGDLRGDEYFSSLLRETLNLAPQKLIDGVEFIAPVIAKFSDVAEGLKRAAKDFPSLKNFEPLLKKLKTVTFKDNPKMAIERQEEEEEEEKKHEWKALDEPKPGPKKTHWRDEYYDPFAEPEAYREIPNIPWRPGPQGELSKALPYREPSTAFKSSMNMGMMNTFGPNGLRFGVV